MTDDFSKTPISIGEARAKRSTVASDWTPRDALVDLLRQIDSAEIDVDLVVIAYRSRKEDGGFRNHYSAAAPTEMPHEAVGALEFAKALIMGDE